MNRRSFPLVLEDRTGHHTSTDFDDMYDRLYFRVARTTVPQRASQNASLTMIYQMNHRHSRHRESLPFNTEPSVILEFPNEALGNISFIQQPGIESGPSVTLPMSRYLRKTALFGASLSRKFVAFDGREYWWRYQAFEGQEWTCTDPQNRIIAHYDLKPPNVRAYDVSGHTLVISDGHFHLTIELIASLTIMRHIAIYNL